MAIANRTQAECQALKSAAITALKAVENYLGDSRNPGMAAGVDTALTALKTQLDATVADATPTPD